MGFFWSSTPQPASATATTTTTSIPNHSTSGIPPPACPMHNKELPTAVCPIVKDSNKEELNPLTNMPYDISTSKLPGQTIDLPTNRTFSTIPRGDDKSQGVWEYPSPQQMFNAMIRKGKGDVPEDAVESMVNIHNFLNEGAWEEIEDWEKPYTLKTNTQPRLLKFTGRPDTISPRARYYNLMSKIFPESYGTELPFDRHDWTVLRSDGNGGWDEIRYVIDYYSGGDDPFGLPSFYLDVRPGLDNIDNAIQRFNHWKTTMKPLWDKAMGHPVDNSNINGENDK
ncbi:holocytochrome c synthase [Pichia californica]|uniref:Holocytochrome c-type synthase n=1 Tax=Pichia californica TaxID=460514 RepID=A0A9P6WQR1_9ASCO|nr:holocytochrome c synthase [[Candida] californica]KAG0691436.1 holocytochrome c synthase [[Candida] californica]